MEMLDAIKVAAAQEEEREYEKQRLIAQTHELVDREMGRG